MERLTESGYEYHSCDFMDDGVYIGMNRLREYEDTGLTPDEINALRDIKNYVERKFDGALTLKRIVDAFCEFYDANSDGERVAKARLLTNGSVDKWEELNERDTAKAIVVDDMTGGMKLYSCPICDMPVHEKDNFCPECGQRLKLATETQRPE